MMNDVLWNGDDLHCSIIAILTNNKLDKHPTGCIDIGDIRSITTYMKIFSEQYYFTSDDSLTIVGNLRDAKVLRTQFKLDSGLSAFFDKSKMAVLTILDQSYGIIDGISLIRILVGWVPVKLLHSSKSTNFRYSAILSEKRLVRTI